MASGPAFKVPKKVGDQITQEYRYKDRDGNLISGKKVIIDTEDVDWASLVGEEIMSLLNTGELTLPDAASVTVNLKREYLTDQMEYGRHTYQLSSAAKHGQFAAYLNGLNVTGDVELAADGRSFEFNSEYEDGMFAEDGATIFVDYIELE
mgnify:CR=1 FL=1|tara:strand:+ start:527 stop:976 length:450 start_codon:yes stop_codon:yes gene_type:complete